MYIRGYLEAVPIPYVQGATLNLPKPYLSTTILVDVGTGQGQLGSVSLAQTGGD